MAHGTATNFEKIKRGGKGYKGKGKKKTSREKAMEYHELYTRGHYGDY